MDWQDKYLCPNVEREKFSFKKIKNIVKDFFILLVHSISFHENPRKPLEELPDFVTQDDDLIFNICKGFYEDANERIDKIEDKAIKLLPYISAIFAFISFAFVNTSILLTKVMFLIAMVLLILSILISFRCVNIKGRETIFIPTIYDFSKGTPIDIFNKKNIAKGLLNSSIYNHNVADNAADILKSSRYMFCIALVISIIGITIGTGGYFKPADNVYAVKVENNKDLSELKESINNTNEILNEISANIDNIKDTEEINDQVNKMLEEMELIQISYNELLIKVEELGQVINVNN